MKQDELARLLNMTRENVSNIEAGKVEIIDEGRCRILIAKLGLNPSELTEDPKMLGEDFLPSASFEARRVGRAWDKLPAPMRAYLLAQIDAYENLSDRMPVLADAVVGSQEPIGKPRQRREA